MAFCSRCGQQMDDGAAFCAQCGAVAAGGAPDYRPYRWKFEHVALAGGIEANIAALLCYAFWWVSGIVFLLIDKRPFVRFHAAQSIVVMGTLFVLRVALLIVVTISGSFFGLWATYHLVSWLLLLATMVAWIGLMAMAYMGREYEVPIAGGIARRLLGELR